MKHQVATLFILYGLLALAAADKSYRGRAYVKKTSSYPALPDIPLKVKVEFRSRVNSQKSATKTLPGDTTFPGLGSKVMDKFFDVSGTLNYVDFTVYVLGNDPDAFDVKICNLLIAGSQVPSLGSKTYTCAVTNPRRGLTSKWEFKLKIDVIEDI